MSERNEEQRDGAMTVAELDPALCRQIAEEIAGLAILIPEWRAAVAAQLTAAADLAKRTLTEERVQEVVVQAFNAEVAKHGYGAGPHIAARAAKELVGWPIGPGVDEWRQIVESQRREVDSLLRDNQKLREQLAGAVVSAEQRNADESEGVLPVIAPTDPAAERAAEYARSKAGAVVARPETPAAQPATTAIGPEDTTILDEALDYYDRTGICAPHDAIARIRAKLASPGGGE